MNDIKVSAVALSGEVLDSFPQLREKAVVDAVNGLEVVGDHLRWRDEQAGSFFSRLWSGFTGSSTRRQQAIDRGVESVLSGISECLHELTAAQAQSDIALSRVAERLLETRHGVMKLQSRQRDVQQEVFALGRRLTAQIKCLEVKLSTLQKVIRVETARGRAWEAIAAADSRWRSSSFDGVPSLLRAVLAANDLYWGDFGAFLRLNRGNGEDADKLLEHARYTLGNLVDDFAAAEQTDLIIVERWLEPLDDMSVSTDLRDAIEYLLEGTPCDVQPLAAAAAVRLQGSKDALPGNLLRLVQPRYLGELAVRETVRRIESEQRNKKEFLP